MRCAISALESPPSAIVALTGIGVQLQRNTNPFGTIHEIDETPDGQLYLVMAQGPLALADAIDIATQVGRG